MKKVRTYMKEDLCMILIVFSWVVLVFRIKITVSSQACYVFGALLKIVLIAGIFNELIASTNISQLLQFSAKITIVPKNFQSPKRNDSSLVSNQELNQAGTFRVDIYEHRIIQIMVRVFLR